MSVDVEQNAQQALREGRSASKLRLPAPRPSSFTLDSQNVTSNLISIELLDFEADQHLTLLKEWMERSHVSRWWGDSGRNLSELRLRSELAHAIIAANNIPVGYLCWQTPSLAESIEAGLADLPNDLIDVDIMIGELDALGKGVGPKALKCLFERFIDQGVSLVGLAGAVANNRAMRAYEKAGLFPYRDFFENGEDYRYFTIDLTSSAQQGALADAQRARRWALAVSLSGPL
jgi:aminoglycoside 6'-N-acetyltransferase